MQNENGCLSFLSPFVCFLLATPAWASANRRMVDPAFPPSSARPHKQAKAPESFPQLVVELVFLLAAFGGG